MDSQRVFETESIDLASYLMAAEHDVAIQPSLLYDRKATFRFGDDAGLRDAIVAYESGASLPAKRLLNSRSYLFREASRVAREGVRR